MYAYSYLKTATSILEQYNGEVPLAIHLKSYFKLNKKYGGRDRKMIAHFCYCYFRTGNLFKKELIQDRICKSYFLSTNAPTPLLEQLNDNYNTNAALTLQQKFTLLGIKNTEKFFPLINDVSDSIDKQLFVEKQLQQPYLFVRIRPKHLASVLLRLKKVTFEYTLIDPYTIQLANGFKVEEHFEIDKEVVIQDYSSQLVLQSLLANLPAKQSFKVWDCCAASGGKSILVNDMYHGNIDLFVTDIRTSILENLTKRFTTARVMNYKLAEVNLFKKKLDTKDEFDVIICDAPCSGSGTWSRTPEQIAFFRNKQLEEYSTKQKNIATNAAKSLRQGGYFVYITCSVLVQENENVVNHLIASSQLQLLSMEYIKGYALGADTMFVALLKS
jgi:16S rRNA (cytosine967-C5)-methyltransferase